MQNNVRETYDLGAAGDKLLQCAGYDGPKGLQWIEDGRSICIVELGAVLQRVDH